MTLLALDLFSGTGAATAAFSEHGWEVIRIDNDSKLRPDLIADVRELPIMCKPDFIWASPPVKGTVSQLDATGSRSTSTCGKRRSQRSASSRRDIG